MPVLPLIDLLIFIGWTTLAAGGVMKAIYLATSYRPTLFSMTPIDLFVIAMGCLGLALTLAARTWVRLNEPQMLANRRPDARLGESHPARWAERDETPAAAAQPRPEPGRQWERVR